LEGLLSATLLPAASASAGAESAHNRATTETTSGGNPLFQLLDRERATLGPVWTNPEQYQLQLLYTRIDRDGYGRPTFRNYGWRLDRARYFWPASMVKLPMAAFALERARSLGAHGVNRDTPLFLEDGPACRMPDPDAGDSIARSVLRSLIVSENPAYSRLFDVVGAAQAGQRLAAMGHADARIVARFVPCTREENRSLSGLHFRAADGRTLLRIPARLDAEQAPLSNVDATVAAAFLDDAGQLLPAPTDFSTRNFLPLEVAHRLLMAVMFPAAMPAHERFDLSIKDLMLMRAALSTRPAQSIDPIYDVESHPDSHVRLFGWGAGRRTLPPGMTSYSKIGEAFGYLSECAYIVDRDRGIEFMVSGVGYFNADGVLNDDRYEYETVGYPFFERVGQVLLSHERARARRGRFDPEHPWYDG
jgi:hypothetical protein